MENNYEEMIQAIRSTTERIIAEGPESCHRFLLDAGIIAAEDSEEAPELVKTLHGKQTIEDELWAAKRTVEYLTAQLAEANQKIRELQL